MKRLSLTLALLALTAATAQAGTLFTVENNAGGLIRLTDEVSTSCSSTSRSMYSTSATDSGIRMGCWSYSEADEMVFVRWLDTQQMSSYDMKRFTTTAYTKANYPVKAN